MNALIELDENTNRVLNIIKAKYALKDKSQAIKLVVNKYIEDEEEPELRPEFIKEMQKIAKQKPVRIGTIDDFKKRYSLD